MTDVLMPNTSTVSAYTLNTRIKKLSPLLINQLAAGEVVTRPAAVVKELLENAIDANATQIEVHITQGGMGMIQVIDNGTGIHPDDMVMAITRHATSKIADVANLQGINTLGFRGEALAATAAVSRLSLTSSHDDSGIGRQLQVAGILAEEPRLMPVVHSRGTTVTIKDLYFNVPARRGNLKSIATEFAHVETIVREVALARADVTLSLFHDNKKRLTLSASSNTNANHSASTADAVINNNRYLPISRLEQALGLALADNALAVTIDLMSLLTQDNGATTPNHTQLTEPQQASINGWLWPTATASKPLPKLLYINGRLIKEPIISNQLRQLAASANMTAMGYALCFELPPQWLNVNVHPSKQRIKISPLNNILAHLSHVVANTLKTVEVGGINSNEIESVDTKSIDTKSNQIALLSEASLDNHSYHDNAAHTEKRSSTKNHQLQSIKQSYQHSRAQQPSAHYQTPFEKKAFEDDGFTDNGVDISRGLGVSHPEQSDKETINNPAQLMMLSTLPHCLDVITDLSMYTLSSANLSANSAEGRSADNHNADTLPWLLFYHQSQLVLIKQSDWQQSFDLIFADSDDYQNNSVTKHLTDSLAIRQCIKQHINQRINRYATQMSMPDLQAFATDMTAILNSKAISHADSQQLIALLLSSAAT